MKDRIMANLSLKIPVIFLICFFLFIVFSSMLMFDTSISIVFTSIMIIALLMVLFYFESRSSPKTKINQETIILKPQRLLAKLILPKDREMIVKDYELVLGREDFLGIDTPEKLMFIGKKHFKLTKLDDGFYIEDLKSKNGTMINNSQIKGLGNMKLKNGDIICVANVLKIVYIQETLKNIHE